MTSSAHRPLSDWIADLIATPTPHLGTVNGGLERQDARSMARFADGWERTGVEFPGDGGTPAFALGLRTTDGEEVVVELDDYGRPLPIDVEGVALIREVEEHWPVVRLTPEQASTLTRQPVAVRFAVLHRLVTEGAPGPRIFHTLPWERVDAFVERLLASLTPGAQTAPDWDWLGHWFSPAVSGLAGSLDQLGQGISDDDESMIRVASTALCNALSTADVERIPESTATGLVTLIDELSRRNPFLRHTADLARGRLTRAKTARHYWLETRDLLTKAAASDTATPQVVEVGDEDALMVQTTTSREGRLTVTATFPLPSGTDSDRIERTYGGVFLPLTYRLDEGDRTYWIVLRQRAKTVSGDVILDARFGRLDADAAPVGVDELGKVPPSELVSSIDAADVAGRREWNKLADRVPPSHAIAEAVRLWAARLEDHDD